jgi:hypothetical protein
MNIFKIYAILNKQIFLIKDEIWDIFPFALGTLNALLCVLQFSGIYRESLNLIAVVYIVFSPLLSLAAIVIAIKRWNSPRKWLPRLGLILNILFYVIPFIYLSITAYLIARNF